MRLWGSNSPIPSDIWVTIHHLHLQQRADILQVWMRSCHICQWHLVGKWLCLRAATAATVLASQPLYRPPQNWRSVSFMLLYFTGCTWIFYTSSPLMNIQTQRRGRPWSIPTFPMCTNFSCTTVLSTDCIYFYPNQKCILIVLMRNQLQCMTYVMALCIKHAIGMAFQWESNKMHITQPPLEVVTTISNTHFSSWR